MKFASLFLACAPSAALALVGCSWRFENASVGGLDDLSFSFYFGNAPQETGYFYGQQFNFEHLKPEELSYAGFQPREKRRGKSIIYASFSSFAPGTVTTHRNCFYQGGPGVNCGVEVEVEYCHIYKITIRRQGSRKWVGTLFDEVTGNDTEIGQWTSPERAGRLLGSMPNGCFVEYLPWNDGRDHKCQSLPASQATFYNPTTSTRGAGLGWMPSVWEYGDCGGKTQFSSRLIQKGGWNISVGHK